MDSNPEIGLMLPCNITVYEKNNQTVISLAKPTSILSITSDKDLEKIGF